MFNECVGQILGQNKIIADIIKDLNEKKVFVIKGERGQGKTFLANELINKIKQNKINYKCLFLSNEKKITLDDYEPFFSIVKDDSIIKENFKNQVWEISQEYKLTKIISHILKIFSGKKYYTKLKNFNNEEMNLILFFNNELKNKKVIWFCDNVHKWSDASKKLLLSIIRYKNHFEGLKNLRIIIISDSECDYFDDDCDLHFKLKSFNQNDFKKIMSFNYNDVIDFYNKSDSIYNISNQNLKIAEELYEIVNDKQNIDFNNLKELVTNHFKNNINDGLNILAFLEKVAFLGTTTLKKLLELFLDIDKNKQYSDYLKQTISMKILNDEDENVKFINTVIYDSIVSSINQNEKKEDYNKLSECIYLLFPSNYITRAEYLLYANEKSKAQIQYILHCLQYFRQKKEEIPNLSSLEFFEIEEGILEFYKGIINLYNLYYKNELKKEVLEETIINISPSTYGIKEFEFEIDYIKSLYYINYSYKKDDFDKVKNILLKWYSNNNFKISNCEMWVRASILLRDLYYELNIDKEERENIKIQLDNISKKYPLDSYMKDMCYIFYLKSNMYFEIQIAFYCTKKALNYFSKNISIYNNQQYLVSVINHSANCIVLNKYEEAYELIYNLTFNNSMIFDKLYPELLSNNFILSCYLSNKCSSKEAIKNMEIISKYESADKILIQNNLTVLYAESGNFKKAIELSENLYKKIKKEYEVDEYYKYFIINNYSILNFLNGNKEKSIKIFEDIQNMLPSSNNIDYFISRNAYIKEMLNNVDRCYILSNNRWNLYLNDKYPKTIGEAWNFWGKLLLFSDLQIWSDC